jgi:zeta-carotene isomerase
LKSSLNPRKHSQQQLSSARRWRAEAQPEVNTPSAAQPSVPKIPTFVSSVAGGPPEPENGNGQPVLVGEDAAVFDVEAQKTSSWIYFTLVLGVVMAILYYIWLDPNTGYGGAFIDALYSLSSNHEVVMVAILVIFALVHSGGAGLRAQGEKLIGERAYRVLFAGISLPLAVSAVVYFINHRYDGVQLWQLRTVPGVHEFVWILSFISFLFLYPSTFNLLEVAAVDKPKVHMWETGIMRITRHPQMVGQFLWCLAHTLWIGNSFTVTTSIGLLAHHLFGVWHGDKRLAAKYGDAFEKVKERTSVIPFAAILDGRQKLPEDYYKEFLRVPYYAIVVFTLGAYFSHPLMQWGSHILHW